MQIYCLVFALCCSFLFSGTARAQTNEGVLQVQFLDSQTGYAVRPDVAISGFKDRTIRPLAIDVSGRAQTRLPLGDYTITVTASNHQAMATAVAIKASTRPF